VRRDLFGPVARNSVKEIQSITKTNIQPNQTTPPTQHIITTSKNTACEHKQTDNHANKKDKKTNIKKQDLKNKQPI
jgi:hypothetical protein